MDQDKQKYNQILERLNKAELYFQNQYSTDTQAGQDWARKMLRALVLDQDKLYKQLRQISTTSQLLSGFTENQMTIEVTANDMDNIIERINIIQENGWKIEKLEFLRKSQVLLIGCKRSEAIGKH